MARGVVVIITVSDTGHITVDARGPLKGKEGLLMILESARKLVEQGDVQPRKGNWGSNTH